MPEQSSVSRDNTSQRRDISNTIGFERYGIVEHDLYEPPQTFPQDAQLYLKGLSKCGTMSGGSKLAGISVNRVYELRRKLEGFRDEEDIAKNCLTDAIEHSLFKMGYGLDETVTGSARVKAAEIILKANRPDKYNRARKHEVSGQVNMTWFEIMQKADQDAIDVTPENPELSSSSSP